MKELIAQIDGIIDALKIDLAKAAEGNKAAAARARKATLELEKVGKEFRKVSIAEAKK
ncbi:MAG: histone H1 [Prevotellaceae bacterium]|nr:histone H1 [Candidatus Colivivens equi]